MSEDDNVLVQGVSGDPGGLGYFGFAYYHENQGKLKLLGIAPDPQSDPIQPSLETISQGEYRPLSRPLFLYINKASAKRPEVTRFVEFYLSHASEIAQHPRVGYVGLPDELMPVLLERFRKGITGSPMASVAGDQVTNLRQLYAPKAEQ
jgi:phosphate transport system substrate-binding protein